MVHHWEKSEKEFTAETFGKGTETEAIGGSCFLALLQDPCSTPFLMHPNQTCLGMALPTVAQALYHHFAIKNVPHWFTHWKIWYRPSTSWGSIFTGVSTKQLNLAIKFISVFFASTKCGITKWVRSDYGTLLITPCILLSLITSITIELGHLKLHLGIQSTKLVFLFQQR